MRFLELLYERTAYDAMFAPLAPHLQTMGVEPSTIDQKVREIRLALGRNDRVVWFLRLWRIGLMMTVTDLMQRSKPDDPLVQTLSGYLNEYQKASGMSRATIIDRAQNMYRMTSNYLRQLTHYLSLPIPDIQKRVFRFDDPTVVFNQFRAFEKTWQDSRQGMIPQQEAEAGAKVLLQFPNGFAWWFLERAFCPHEAEAMGHCGNEPRAGSDDRILSLRKLMRLGKQTFYMPYCTFILEEGGVLGEMKGRFNQSPKHAFAKGFSPSNFNDEIFALLKLPMIEEVRGGGYMPEENFKLADLAPEQMQELLKVKPQLMPLSEQFKRDGVTPLLIKKIVGRVSDYQNIRWDQANKGFVWDYDVNLRKFIENHVEIERNRRQAAALWALKVLEGNDDSLINQDYHVDESSKEDLLNLLERKHPDVYAKLVTHVEQLWDEQNPRDAEDEDEDDRPELAEMIREVDDEIDSALYRAVSDGQRMGAEGEMARHFYSWLDDLKAPGERWIVLPEWDAKYFDSQVNILVDVPTMIAGIEAGEIEQWADDGDEFWQIEDLDEPSYGYADYDEDAALESLTNDLPF